MKYIFTSLIAITDAIGFSIGDKGYIGTGINVLYENRYWEYIPDATDGLLKLTYGDSFGDISNGYFMTDCVMPADYVIDTTDCNDTNA
jgi:hypothetical protein